MFGADFSGVRIHDNPTANHASSLMGAQAYTVGSDIAFAAGQFDPSTADGRHILHHELSHVVQQGAAPDMNSSPVEPMPTPTGGVIHRASNGLADVWSYATAAVSSLTDAASGALGAVESKSEEAASALQGALTDASALARAIGGQVELVGTKLVITVPEFPLTKPHTTPIAHLPSVFVHLPLIGGGAMLGPLLLEGDVGLHVALRPEVIAMLGPLVVRRVRIELDPLNGSYTASGRLHVDGSSSLILFIEPGVDLSVLAVILAGEIPIPVQADAFGGLRLALRGSGLGSLDETVTLSYDNGTLFLNTVTDMKMGARIDAELDAAVSVYVFNHPVCQYTWPLGSWLLAENADQFTLPLSLGYSDGKSSFSAGPLGINHDIPVSSIEARIPTLPRERDCQSLDRLIDVLCRNGVIPKELCALKGHGGSAEFAPDSGPATALGQMQGDALPQSGHLAPTGTSKDPIPMVWYKPLHWYLDPVTLMIDGEKRKFRRNQKALLPHGEAIGVSYWPSKGDKIYLTSPTKRSKTMQNAFNAALKRYGFNNAGWNADHVEDVEMGGFDDFDNLWPLEAGVNQRAGLWQLGQAVVFSKDTEPVGNVYGPIAILGQEYLRGRWFMIVDVKDPP
jgi:hypothetical protein